MRGVLVIIHRWAGLFIAVFLFIAGLTGAVISWDHELDEWLNPDLLEAKQPGTPLPPLELVARFEASDPRARVTYFTLSPEAGKTVELFVEPRVDPTTGRLYDLDYNQVYMEPATGEITGKRYWGKISLDRRDILPFLYKLHYSMHIPDFYGYDRWGIWLMGIVGIVWMFDCFVGLCLTFPPVPKTSSTRAFARVPGNEKTWLARWSPAWRIKRDASAYRLNFDIHRAVGLWAWLFLLVLAFTSISMNLGDDVVRPLLSKVSSLTADADAERTPAPIDKPVPAALSFASILDRASAEAAKRSWQEPLGSAFYNQQTGIYSVSFFKAGKEHGEYGMEPKTLHLDGNSGEVLGDSAPWAGTAADIFMQLQFPLHSGRIAGLPGRILLSVMGLIVAALSFTGIVIWFKKRAARAKRARYSGSEGATPSRGQPVLTNPALAALLESARKITDEDRLRSRLMWLGKTATSLSAQAGRLRLGSIASLSLAIAGLTARAALISGIRVLRRVFELPNVMARALGSISATLLSRGFWEAGRTDAVFYARQVRQWLNGA